MQIIRLQFKLTCLAVLLIAFCPLGRSQQQVSYALLQPETLQPETLQPAAPLTFTPAATTTQWPEHPKFWDRENTFLFAAVAAVNTADFVVTRDNLRSGGRELNPVTRVFTSSTPMLALNFAGETAGVVSISYLFHKTGHHKLERAVSMFTISASGAAVTYDLSHR
jgi:hypothetical protein